MEKYTQIADAAQMSGTKPATLPKQSSPVSFVATKCKSKPAGVPVDPSLAVVLLPGLGANALCFLPVFVNSIGAAAGAAWALAVTYATPFGPTLADAARQVWQGLAALPASFPAFSAVSRVLIIGYSMGGMVAANMVAAQPCQTPTTAPCPRAVGVVYLASATPASGGLPVPTPELLQAALHRVKSPDGPTAAAVRGSARLRTMFPGFWLDAAPQATILDMTAALAAGRVPVVTRSHQLLAVGTYLLAGGPGEFPATATVPALVLHGMHDRVLQFSAAKAAAEAAACAGKPVTFVAFPHAGHGMLYQDPHGTAAAVQTWWQDILARGQNHASVDASASACTPASTSTLMFVPPLCGAVMFANP
jgi:pimeloyl-ACP methyl ester carboxylesterase